MFKLMQEKMDLGYKLSTMICIEENCNNNLVINKEDEITFCAKCNIEKPLKTIFEFMEE
jgi:hypothetical protein